MPNRPRKDRDSRNLRFVPSSWKEAPRPTNRHHAICGDDLISNWPIETVEAYERIVSEFG
jgi:hypothetical protein